MVQGFEAAPQIAAAIRTLDRSGRADVIIVARGGGSREDLWVFNAEVIARAAFACKTPLISAIGHEIDYTWTSWQTREPRRPRQQQSLRCRTGKNNGIFCKIYNKIFLKICKNGSSCAIMSWSNTT